MEYGKEICIRFPRPFNATQGNPRSGQVCFFNRFLHFAPALSAKAETGASVEMTVGFFNRADF
jgi:hypothetical protein